jgi:Flp pilus assembly protein TadD
MMVPAAVCCLLAGCGAKPNDQSLTASSRLHVAEAAEESGDKQTAGSMYLAAAEQSQGDSGLQIQCAEGLVRTGRLDDAEAVLTRRLGAAPHDTEVLRTLGAVEVMSGKQAAAMQSLSAVLMSKPDDLKAMVDKGVALDMLHRHAEAQGLYRHVLTLAPQDAAVSNDLALSLLLSGQAAAGARVLAPFRENAGLPERIRTNLGIMDAARGRGDDARMMLGSRIGASDLASLTQAIGRGAATTRGTP